MSTPEMLDQIGSRIAIMVDPATHQLILAVHTDVGTITAQLSQERACQLGVSLIRESGKVFNFAQAQAQPQEGARPAVGAAAPGAVPAEMPVDMANMTPEQIADLAQLPSALRMKLMAQAQQAQEESEDHEKDSVDRDAGAGAAGAGPGPGDKGPTGQGHQESRTGQQDFSPCTPRDIGLPGTEAEGGGNSHTH
jgi:hypothetical protein